LIFFNFQLTVAQRAKRKLEAQESEKMVELMGTVTEALKKKPSNTSDDYFVSQLLCHLQSIPDSREKEKLKLKLLDDIIEFRYGQAHD